MEAPGKVVIWEPLEDVAHAACEVWGSRKVIVLKPSKRSCGDPDEVLSKRSLHGFVQVLARTFYEDPGEVLSKRSLRDLVQVLVRESCGDPGELARCRVVSGDPPPHVGGLVVVDRWHGLGVLGAEVHLVISTCSFMSPRVVPSRLSISLALADAGLGETQGLDLSAMDARFRGLATGPLRDLASPSLALDGPKSLAFSARPSKLAANACVFECRFELPRSKNPASLRFAQWIPGGLQLAGAESKLCAWRNDSRVWLEWDGAKSLYPPFGFMALSEWYFEMLRDSARHELYEKALQVEITKVKETGPECKVLDVGSGDGYQTAWICVEYVTQIARASEEVIAANRAARKVPETPLEIWCTDVRGIGERESEAERFEVLVTELMDASGLGESLATIRQIGRLGRQGNLILLTEGSKRRLCKATSSVIPAKLRLKAVKLPEINGVNIDAFWPFWPLDRTGDALWLGVDLDKREGLGDFKVLTDPVELLSLRLGEADVDAIPSRASFNFKGMTSGTANMVVWWFEAQLSETDPSVVLTNAPTFLDGRHAATCWGQAAAEIAHTQVLKGESTEILMEMTFGDYQLKFKTPSAGDARFGRFAPPPHVEDYSAEYQQVLQDYAERQRSYLSFAKESRVGHSAIRSADVESVAALQRCALAMALFPGSFGLEGTTANRVLVSWSTLANPNSWLLKTPEAKKRSACTPPPSIQRRLRDDIQTALLQDSDTLLALALLRNHRCCSNHYVYEAVRRHSLRALEYLLKREASDLDEACLGCRPLHVATQVCMFNGDVGYCMMELLLQHGARPNRVVGDDPELDPPLHEATKRGSVPAVSLLLNARASPDEVNGHGDSPLHLACRQTPFQGSDMQSEVVSLLLRHGAKPMALDSLGRPPKRYALDPVLVGQLTEAESRWCRGEALLAWRSWRHATNILPELFEKIVSFL
eukprot:s1531_g21.t1